MPEAHILVVEDESIVAMDIKVRLLSLGYSVVDIVSSGEEAISRVAALHPDVVLMDIKLKGRLNGIQSAEQIQTQYKTPVVFVSAYADKHTLQQAKITGPFGYIIKPFEDSELYTAIEIALYKHHMERKLREKEQWLAAILKSIGDAVIATDTEGRITFMNPVAESLTGWRQGEAIRRDVSRVLQISAGHPDRAAETRLCPVDTDNNFSTSYMLATRDGAQTPIDKKVTAIVDEQGQVAGQVVVFRDVTHLKQAQQALQKSEAEYRHLALENAYLLQQARRDADTKTRLLQEVNHRVKNNLSAILGLVYAEQQRAASGDEQKCPAALNRLTSRIRSLATVHNMLSAIEWTPLPLTELTRQIVRVCLQVVPLDREISVEIAPSSIQITPAQANSLALIINEMVTNVIKHASRIDHLVRIKVSVELVGEDLLYQFRDDGPGFPDQVLQVNRQNVGLYLIRNIVRHDLGGQIQFYNDRGAVIAIRFKLTDSIITRQEVGESGAPVSSLTG